MSTQDESLQEQFSQSTVESANVPELAPDSHTDVPLNGDPDALKPEDLLPADKPTQPDYSKPNSAKPAPATKSSKTNGASGPTASVKKIISAGTFGPGSVKPSASKPAPTSSAATKPPPTSSLRKSTSSGPISKPPTTLPAKAAISNPALSASTTSAPARRSSVVPAKTALSSSTSAKAALSASTSTRATAASPPAAARAPPVARPRASVTDAVKRAPLASRQSIAPSKPAAPTSSRTVPPKTTGTTVTKLARGAASISSIKEIREDGKTVEELQTKLQEVSADLASKLEALANTEGQVAQLKSDLDAVPAAGVGLTELEATNAALQSQLKEAIEAHSILTEEYEKSVSSLKSLQDELETIKSANLTQTENQEKLEARVQSLQEEYNTAQQEYESLKMQAGAAADEAAATKIEHEALLKAHSDMSAISDEVDALKLEHAKALEDALQKLQNTELRAANIDALETQITELRKEKEDSANKVSELEIEILEMKESQDAAEDARMRSSGELDALKEELAKASAATQQAIDHSKAKEAEYLAQAGDSSSRFEDALKAAAAEQAKAAADLGAVKADLAEALSSCNQLKVDFQAAADEHALKLAEKETAYLAKQAELTNEIKRITEELEGQESAYAAKVDAIKVEHDRAINEAFERAKSEAMEVHSQDLQITRTKFDATAAQIHQQHESSLEDLKAEHAAILESELSALKQQINSLGVDLKATQLDLAKSKAAEELSRTELATVIAQLEAARAAANEMPEPSPELTDEIARLTNQLSVTKDDLAAVNEMVALTKASMADLTQNHATDLTEAAEARARAEEKLRATHSEEISSLASQKAELSEKLTDLEGELAQVKAKIAEPPTTKPNGTNGNATVPQSPGISKEELQRLHEAHNLKIGDLQAAHEKELKAVKEDLEATLTKAEESEAQVARKLLEIQYLEQESDDNTDRVTSLEAEVESLKQALAAKDA